MLLNYNFNKILSPQIFLLFLLFLVSCDTQVNTEGTTASADTEDNVTIIADADQDGIADVNDSCPLSQVIGDTDYDGDGCFNSEDTDDDNDGVFDLVDFFGSLPPELSKLRNKMDEKYLKKGLAKMYSNWQELWNEL